MASTVTCPGCQVKLKLKPEYAGKKLKCPRCTRVMLIPAARNVTAAPPKAVAAKAAAAPAGKVPAGKAPPLPAKTKPKPVPFEDDDAAVVTAPAKKKKDRKTDMTPCPECGEMVDVDAKKCPYCKVALEADDEEEYKKWRKCPRCGKQMARSVLWTIWGSFYMTRLFHHVRCEECGLTYNGTTGKSNRGPAVVCLSTPLLAIAGIGYFVSWIVKDRGHYEYEWLDTVSLIVAIIGAVGLLAGIVLWMVMGQGQRGARSRERDRD
jgi:hypothetical protein